MDYVILTEALSRKDYKLAKSYVSTAYFILAIIIGIFYVVFVFINPNLNWAFILNASPEFASSLELIVFVVVTFFCFRFVLKLIGTISISDQNPTVNNILSTLENALALVGIFIITKISNGNLFYVSLIYSGAPILILFIASIYFF